MSRVALITGGSRGLGAHLVRRFWYHGYSLVVAARSKSEIDFLLASLPSRVGQNALSLECDLGETKQVEKLIDFVGSTFEYLDVLINNAAIQGPIGPFIENDLTAWELALRINLVAPVYLCHGLASVMKRSANASIVNLSGGGATGPRPNFSSYAASKAALVRFSETLSEEFEKYNIRVNCIAPGAMKTDMLAEILRGGDMAGIRELSAATDVLSGGGASMDRVADLALFLASDVSKGISGKLISAQWDRWEDWPKYVDELSRSDAYTLRRITGRDRGLTWGDR